jgi:hypothetical protein
MPEEARPAAILALMEAFNPDTADATITAYLEACHGSRPMLRVDDETAPVSRFKAPFEEFIAAYILRVQNGYTRKQLMEEMPCSLVFWIFESIREQVDGKSLIYTESEKARDEYNASPEGKAATELYEKTAGKIIAVVSDPKKRMELLISLDAGKLPKDWLKRYRKGVKK